MDATEQTAKAGMPLHRRIFLGAIAGIVGGGTAHLLFGGDPALAAFIRYVTQPVGQVFLRLLFMLVIPLMFSALALGVSGLGDLRSLGRLGLKTLAYTVLVSAVAVVLGLGLVNWLRPGEGLAPELRQQLSADAAERSATVAAATAPESGIDLLVKIVPDNPIRAAAGGDLMAVMFFALMMGIGLSLTPGAPARRLEEVLQGLYEVMMRLIGLVIGLAPIGVGALLFTLTAGLGYTILIQLARYVGVVVLALAIHQFGVYSLILRFVGRTSPLHFFRSIQEAMLTAFSTASSSATLPTALRVAEERLALPPHVSRFVLTLGATANQNGTALFEGVTVLFLAQFYGVSLSLGQQVLVLVVCILGGVGTAGVPAGSLPVVAMILGMIGVPVEGIGVILGVDRFLDMCRTTLNVTGDLAAAVVISRGEERSSVADPAGLSQLTRDPSR